MKLKATPPPVQTEAKEDPNFEVLTLDPTTIFALAAKARMIADNSKDYNVTKATHHNVRFNESAGLTFIPDEDGDIHQAAISRYALGQLGTKIGVPANYLEKCVKSGRLPLAQDNVNSWLETFGKNLFLREYDGRIRGVLSSKYSVCDSHEILGVLESEIDLSRFKIKGSFLNEERLHIRLVSKDLLPIDGEDLFAGLFIDSSDVGRSILTVQFGIYKQVCTNGLVVARAGGVLFKQRHIGITADEFQTGLAASLKNVDVLADHAVEWVRTAKSKLVYDTNKMMSEDMTEFLERVRSKTSLPEDGAKKVIELMSTKYGGSQWGLINSITEVAQDYTLERRLDLEKIAGNMLAVA